MRFNGKKKAEQQKREEILSALPTFLNQLLLLLSSGMILDEALARIALHYSEAGREQNNAFAAEYIRVYHESRKTGESMTGCLARSEAGGRVKEFSRVIRIMADSEKSGADLWNRLASESEALWAERKQAALEKIRIAESKMSFPLGLLLTALILITAAPAMLQIYL